MGKVNRFCKHCKKWAIFLMIDNVEICATCKKPEKPNKSKVPMSKPGAMF